MKPENTIKKIEDLVKGPLIKWSLFGLVTYKLFDWSDKLSETLVDKIDKIYSISNYGENFIQLGTSCFLGLCSILLGYTISKKYESYYYNNFVHDSLKNGGNEPVEDELKTGNYFKFALTIGALVMLSHTVLTSPLINNENEIFIKKEDKIIERVNNYD
ncbi:hypothetical protein ACFL1H_02710, partial [Nanoarchaeota archaeon]